MKTKRIMRLMSMALVAIASLGFFSCSSDDGDNQGGGAILTTPENVRGTAANGKATVTWNAVYGATSYKVFRLADNGNFLPIGISQSNSFIDNSPLPGSNYYRVQACGANGAYSGISAVTQLVNHGESGIYNGHEYVDLGLPSGLKWATCNIGALFPFDYGNYYDWGDTETHYSYFSNGCYLYGKYVDDISGNPRHDVARANWGGSWRLPTKAEFEELVNKCVWIWTSQGSIEGYKVIGSSGDFIFLPAAGCRDGLSLSDAESVGYYWSSSPYEDNTRFAYELNFSSSYHDVVRLSRYIGCSVRPVSE